MVMLLLLTVVHNGIHHSYLWWTSYILIKISTIFGKTRKIRCLTYQKNADFAWYSEHETDVSMAVDKHVVHHVSKNSFLCGRKHVCTHGDAAPSHSCILWYSSYLWWASYILKKISTIFGKTRKIRGRLPYQKNVDFAWYSEHETDVSMAVHKHDVHHVSENSFLCGRKHVCTHRDTAPSYSCILWNSSYLWWTS